MNYLRPFFSYGGDKEKSMSLFQVGNHFFESITKTHDFNKVGYLRNRKVLEDGSLIVLKSRKDIHNNIYSTVSILTSPSYPSNEVVLRIAVKDREYFPKTYVFERPNILTGIPDPLLIDVGSSPESLYYQKAWLSSSKKNMVSFGYTPKDVVDFDGNVSNVFIPTIKVNNNALIKLDSTANLNVITSACCNSGANIVFYCREDDKGIVYLTQPLKNKDGDILIEYSFYLPDGGVFINAKKEERPSIYDIVKFYGSVTKLLAKKEVALPSPLIAEDVEHNYEFSIIEYTEGFEYFDEFNITPVGTSVISIPYSDLDASPSYNLATLYKSFHINEDMLSCTEITKFTGYNTTIEPHKVKGYAGSSPIVNEFFYHIIDKTDFKEGLVDTDGITGSFKVKSRIAKKEEIILYREDPTTTDGEYNIYKEFESIGEGDLHILGIPLFDIPPDPTPIDFDKTLLMDNLVLFINQSFTCKYKIERLSESIPLDGLLGTGLLRELQALDQSYADFANWPYSEPADISANSKLKLHYRGNYYELLTIPDSVVSFTKVQYAFDGFYLVVCGTLSGGVYRPKIGETVMEYYTISDTNPDQKLQKSYLNKPITIIIDTSKEELDYKILDYRADGYSSSLYFIPLII